MSSELERRLERALGEAPGPDPGVTDRALRVGARGAAVAGRGPTHQAPPDRAAPGRVHGGVRLGRRHARGDGGAPSRGEPRAGEEDDEIRAAIPGRRPSRRNVDLGGRRGPGRGGHEADADPAAPRRARRSVLGQPGLAVRRRRPRRDAARARDPRAAGRVGPSQPRRPACGRRVVTLPDPDRLPASHGERLHGRRPLGQRHAPVHGRHDSRAGDAHLAVGLEGAGLRERIRRSRGPRRHRRCEPAAPTGMRDTAAGCDRVRSGRGRARGGRPGGARGPGRHVGRAGRPLPGRGRRPAPPGLARPQRPPRRGRLLTQPRMRSRAPRRSRAPS